MKEDCLRQKLSGMDEFTEYVLDLMSDFGEVSAKRMFGGKGFFYHGLMFAISVDDVLYFKVDELLKPEYEELGLEPFRYDRQGKKVALSYYQAPDSAMNNHDRMSDWAEKSYAAAKRAKK